MQTYIQKLKLLSMCDTNKFNLTNLRHRDFTNFIENEIKEHSNKRLCLCPFHEEKTPSFYIYPDNSFFCFGCRLGGNAIDFVMKKFNCSFKEACKRLEEI